MCYKYYINLQEQVPSTCMICHVITIFMLIEMSIAVQVEELQGELKDFKDEEKKRQKK